MRKLIDLIKENNKILVPRRSPEERQKNYNVVIQKKIKKYMVDGGKGDLDLRGTPITSLPNGLNVGGNLYLFNNTKITSLPNDLKVRGSLNLYYTKITSLPNDLQVGGYLNLNYTPISKKYTEEQIKQMCPGVKGNIYM